MKMPQILMVLALAGCGKLTSDSRIPAEWGKNLTIELYEGGGMLNRSTRITYTYDSGKYVHHIDDVDSVKSFALSDAGRLSSKN